jgi:Mce-associated membrane protein
VSTPPPESPVPADTAGPEPESAEPEPGPADTAGPGLESAEPEPGPADTARPGLESAEPEPGPADTAGPEPELDGQSAGAGAGPRTRTQHRGPVLLGAAAVVLAGLAAWSGIQAHHLRSQDSAQNEALTNSTGTRSLDHQVTRAINTVFSYDYADTGKTRRAAQGLLTGAAVRQYDNLFRLVQREAPAQRLVLTTTVTNSGVELLTGNRARVLIFADQRDTRGTTHQTSYAGAMFAVDAVREGGRWRIDNIDTFTGGA